MSKVYYMRYKNIIIGKFIVDEDGNKKYEITKEAFDVPPFSGFPLGLYPINVHKNGTVKDYIPTEYNINSWVEERVFPPNRQNAHAILNALKLKEYDAWEICVRLKAVSDNDYNWFSEEITDEYKDIHPKANER